MQELCVPATTLAQKICTRDAYIVEEESVSVRCIPADLGVRRRNSKTGSVGRDDDRGEFLRAVILRASHGHDCDETGDIGAGVGNESLGPVDHPLITLDLGSCSGCSCVGAATRFGEPKCPEHCATCECGKPFALLLICPKEVDRHRAKGHGCFEGDCYGGVDSCEFL